MPAGQWEPGQSGNPSGGAKIKRFFSTLERACVQEDYKRLRATAEKLLDAGASGEPWAVQMLADRYDGKPAQQVALTGADDGPLVVKISAEDSKAL